MSSQPPRFVPTLTEVVQPSNAALHAVDRIPAAAVDRTDAENQLVQRVLQRVDLMLERRLREAVGQLIFENTERLLPQLRQEIEAAVHHSVNQAFAQELEGDKKPLGT